MSFYRDHDTLEYRFSDMQEIEPVPHLNLEGITETKCWVPKDGQPYRVFECEASKRFMGGCPCCGSINYSIHGTMKNPRLIHDVNIGIEKIDILLTVKRYLCDDCGASFNHSFQSVPNNRQMTNRLYEQICRDTLIHTDAEVAAQFGYSETTISAIANDYAAYLEANRTKVKAPRVLGVDEKHIVHAMRAVFVDSETGEPLEMLESNKKKDIVDTIMGFDGWENIEVVTMDMANSYRSYVQLCLPKAKIVVDKYHLYQDLNVKLQKCWTKIKEHLDNKVREEKDKVTRTHLGNVLTLAAKNSRLFLFNLENLSEKPSRIIAMADICSTFPEFNHLRLLHERFSNMYDCQDRASAEQVIQDWGFYVPPTGKHQREAWEQKFGVLPELFDEMRPLKNTMKNWKEEIFSYFEPGCKVTNAYAENFNHEIERINREGNGYSFKRLRVKALYRRRFAMRTVYKMQERISPVYGTSFVDFDFSKPRPIIGYNTDYYVVAEEEPIEDFGSYSAEMELSEPVCMEQMKL